MLAGTKDLARESLPVWPTIPAYSESARGDPYFPSPRMVPPTATPQAEAHAPEATPTAKPARLNILLMGVDERETWSDGPPRTDAMILVSVDAPSRSATFLSIPRDLWVNIPGFGQERVNVAYRVAELFEPGSGPQSACDTVAEFLQVPITRYAVVNFRAVTEVVDTLGGLEVEVPREIWDYQYPAEDNSYVTVHFSPGKQVLNGEQVLQYVRTRHDSSDFERMRRQQQVLEAAKARMLQPDFVAKLPGLLLLARDSIRTNLSVTEAISLWSAFRDSRDVPISAAAIDETYTYPWTTGAGAAVLLPDQQSISELVTSLGLREGGSEGRLAQGLQVRLYASNGDDPSFAAATKVLADSGFTVWEAGVHENPTGHTLILDYTNGEQGPLLARALGVEALQVLNLPRPSNLPASIAADVMLWSLPPANS
jgi:LCP family protein required for cell wall assembly